MIGKNLKNLKKIIGMNKLNFNNKNILIVGGTGSFGNQFLKNIIKNKINYNQINILSRDEKKQHDMREKYNSSSIKFYIGDIRDVECTDNATKEIDYVFHAAALKQVPSCEFYPMEATKTNVIGTNNIINSAIKNIQDEYGALYGLVNNAGITNDNLLMRMTEEQWLSVIETNLTSIYRVTKSIVKDMMKAREGRIVNIGSIVGMMGNAGQSNYSASKSGLLGFTKSLARELSSRNINVNSISPGFIDTDMTKALSNEQIDNLSKNIPLGRIAESSEVSSVVSFLLSDDSSYITGENINVNGGLYM